MPDQHTGCVDCVRKENQLELKDRDIREVTEERDYYRQQAEQAAQTARQAQEQAREAEERKGHHSWREALQCPNCGPQTDEEKVEAAKTLAPKAFEPVTIGE